MSQRLLTALPVYNEAKHVGPVLAEVRRYSPKSWSSTTARSDGTTELLAAEPGIHLVTHRKESWLRRRPCGRPSITPCKNNYDVLVTIDCDGQHQPRMIPQFFAECEDWDIVSGSRYLAPLSGDSQPPA